MIKSKDLTQGPIFKQLSLLALPIIANSFFQMAYHITDVFWIGKLGKNELAAVASIGYVIWFAVSVVFAAKIGSEVGISQSIGKKNSEEAVLFSRNAIKLTGILAAFFSLCSLLFAENIVTGIFSLNNNDSVLYATNYLQITSAGFIFTFLNIVFSGIYNGLGNSKLPFYINGIGLVLNMALDPLLIFGWGVIPPMGTAGAALASIGSQAIVAFIYIYVLFKQHRELVAIQRFFKLDIAIIKKILKVGIPVSSQITLFSVFAMIIARLVTKWGDAPIAVISIGANVESISWMTASGFSTALGSFVGQNYGAKKWSRIFKGYLSALSLSSTFGIIAGLVFFFFAEETIGIFSQNEEIISIGTLYMKIVAISQFFMTLEITTSGVFNGMGKSMPPAVVGISANGLRVVFAYLLAYHTSLGLEGVWWSISMSSVLKGLLLAGGIWLLFRRKQRQSVV